MLTKLKTESNLYLAQISCYRGKVYAEIIYNAKEMFETNGLWITSLDKSFGSSFRNTPREKDWIDANKWVDKQLELIEKYATVIVAKPNYLKDLK